MHIQKFQIVALSKRSVDAVRELAGSFGIVRVDLNEPKQLVRIVSAAPVTVADLNARLASAALRLEVLDSEAKLPAGSFASAPTAAVVRGGVLKVAIEGMTCRSCELTIEKKWKELPGVKKVDVDAGRGMGRIVYESQPPDVQQLEARIAADGYRVKRIASGQRADVLSDHTARPSFWRLVGLFALVLLLGKLFSRFDLLRPSVAFGSSLSFGAVFLIGLVAASSSCLAVAGGMLLSSASRFNARYQGASRLAAMRPVFLFVLGRVVSYALLGGLIGALGRALAPSAMVTGGLTVLAAAYMLLMGLEMLGIAPRWLLKILPRMPKAISRRVVNAEGKEHPLAPALLGAGTFFLPCGFTQALQLYALTVGSAATAALIMLAFALGTAPSLLALGWASSALKGNLGKLFFQFSGALVLVLGLWNIGNGFAVAGYPLSWPTFGTGAAQASDVSESTVGDPNVSFDGSQQTMRMTVAYSGYGPDRFTIRAGVPTRWVVDAKDSGGCLAVLQSPRLGIQEFLRPGVNEIAFTPKTPGVYPFSCSMGMFRGAITVI